MIDFDVVTGPGPAEKRPEPAAKPALRPGAAEAAPRLSDRTATPPRPPDSSQPIARR